MGNLLASATPAVRAHTGAPANGTMTRQRLADRLFSSSPHSCCAGGGREARVRAPLVPPAGRNLSGSAGARKPSVQDKAQAAERSCAALEGLPHLVPCRSWGPSAAPASACSPSVPTRLEVPLQRRAPHPQAEPHLDAAAACLEGRGGGQQARRALWASGARWSRPPRPTEHHRSAVAIPLAAAPPSALPSSAEPPEQLRNSCGAMLRQGG